MNISMPCFLDRPPGRDEMIKDSGRIFHDFIPARLGPDRNERMKD